MLSATSLTAAIAILALTVNVIDTDSTPPNQAGATHVVAADGSGQFTTIQQAVDAAEPGDTVSVLPGTYVEAVVIDKDLTLTGDGPREEIVVVAPGGGTVGDIEEVDRPHALLLSGPAVSVSDLTVQVPVGSTGIGATAGSPLIERVSIVQIDGDLAGMWEDPYYALGFYGATTATVRDSDWESYTAVRDATAIFEGNTIAWDGISIDGSGDSVFRDNTFLDGGWLNGTGATATVEGNDFTGGGAGFDSGSVVEVRDNTFRDTLGVGADASAISLAGRGTQATIVNNTVSNAGTGIWLAHGASADIEGNTLGANQMGINVGRTDGVRIDGNTIEGAGAGIVITQGADATVTGNVIDVDGRGISVGFGASPVVSGNEVCGGTGSIWVAMNNDLELADNDVC